MAKKARGNPAGPKKEFHIVAEEAVRYGFEAPVPPAPSERYISPNEAAKILKITGEAVKQWIYHRRLPATKLSNGYWKVKVADLENFIKARQSLTARRVLVYDVPGTATNELLASIEKLGHDPVLAYNVADALLKSVDLVPSIFVINISIQGGKAWKLIERIRNTRKIRHQPIFILADGELSEVESQQALDYGVQGVLPKPVKGSALAAEINKAIGN